MIQFLSLRAAFLAATGFAVCSLAAEPATQPLAKRLFPPRSPADSLAALRVLDGYEVELVASEPLVASPVAIDWGPDGSLWVAEMADYPTGLDGKGMAGGRIKRLESTRGDGRYDKSAVFADGIKMPTGLATWRNGVLVCAAPDILYFRDTHGSGKADVRDVLFTGFSEGNPQLRVNGLRWGLDGWIYCASGLRGGTIAPPLADSRLLNLAGHDFRILPDLWDIDLQSGPSQYGRDRDDWGNWFGCDNSHPMFHFVLADQYLRRNTDAPSTDPKRQLVTPPNGPVFAVSATQQQFDRTQASPGHPGHFTSACSPTIYRDELLFPRDDTRHGFVCEPVHNLVRHEVLKEDGISFTASRAAAEEGREFLASEDPWCRPVMVRTGPDGALWVVDMYRYMVEHPDWLPAGGKEKMAPLFREGDDRGRIYRIYPKGHRPAPVPRLDRLDTAGLVAALGSPNGWVRDKAQQMLLWQRDPSAAGPLLQLVRDDKRPVTRLQALWTLSELCGVDAAVLTDATHDASPAVRRAAIEIAEPKGNNAPALARAVMGLSNDPDAKVRLQLVCTLGEWSSPEAAATLARLALTGDADPQWAAAVVSSAGVHYPAIADALLAARRPVSDPLHRSLLTLALARTDRPTLEKLLGPVLTPVDGRIGGEQIAAFGQFVETAALRKVSVPQLSDGGDGLSKLLASTPQVYDAARRLAADPAAPAGHRAAAVALLGFPPTKAARDPADPKRLADLLSPQTPPEVQAAAVRAITRTGDPHSPALLTRNWPALSASTRVLIIDALIAREAWAIDLLQQVEAGKVPVVQFDTARRGRLLRSPSERVRTAAAKLFNGGPAVARQKVVEQHLPALKLPGDPARGMKLFAQHCATCHRLADVGQEIGPDLRSVGGWERDALLTAILDPSAQVEPRYLGYSATLGGGEVVAGIITAETAGDITIKGLDAREQTIPRTGIASLESTNRSLMPDGLEAAMSDQDLADVIRFLQGGGAGK